MSVAELESQRAAPRGARAACGRRRSVGCAATRARSSGFVLVALFVFVAIFAPLLAPDDPRAQDLQAIFNGCCPGPSAHHLLGVDDLGRDELSRILYGARLSLLIGIVAVSVGLSIGIVLGSIVRLLRRLGRQRPDALRRHHARDSRLPDGDRHRRAARPGPLPGDDRDRRSSTSRSSRASCAAPCSRSARTTSCSPRARSACAGARSSSRTCCRTRSRS